jgi:hypothetical protein
VRHRGPGHQYVRVARNVMADRRSDMEYIIAIRDGSVPSRIACEIGGSEGQPFAGVDVSGNPRANR